MWQHVLQYSRLNITRSYIYFKAVIQRDFYNGYLYKYSTYYYQSIFSVTNTTFIKIFPKYVTKNLNKVHSNSCYIPNVKAGCSPKEYQINISDERSHGERAKWFEILQLPPPPGILPETCNENDIHVSMVFWLTCHDPSDENPHAYQ